MATYVAELKIPTRAHDAMIDITAQVEAEIRKSNITNGTAVIYSPHTTTAITINENADPDVVDDMLAKLNRMFPWREDFYSHAEGNSAAHMKSSTFGCSETVILVDGRLILGTWQGIYFCEFDGPRARRVIVSVTGE